MYRSLVNRQKRALAALHRSDLTLKEGEFICRLTNPHGHCLFSALIGNGEEILVRINEKFRNTYYFPKGRYVICTPLDTPDKVMGEVQCELTSEQVRDLAEKDDWPAAFKDLPRSRRKNDNKPYLEDDMLPPSDDGEEGSDDGISDEDEESDEPQDAVEESEGCEADEGKEAVVSPDKSICGNHNGRSSSKQADS